MADPCKDQRVKATADVFRVLYGKDSTPEERKTASETIKALVAAGDLCFKCRKNPATIGAHGIRNNEIYDEYWCASCYVRVNKQGSSKEVSRLSGVEPND